jgi:hypothetical protein
MPIQKWLNGSSHVFDHDDLMAVFIKFIESDPGPKASLFQIGFAYKKHFSQEYRHADETH